MLLLVQEVKLPDAKLTKDLVLVEGYQSYWSCSQSKTGYSGEASRCRTLLGIWQPGIWQPAQCSVDGC